MFFIPLFIDLYKLYLCNRVTIIKSHSQIFLIWIGKVPKAEDFLEAKYTFILIIISLMVNIFIIN
jgi:hypothetical protein